MRVYEVKSSSKFGLNRLTRSILIKWKPNQAIRFDSICSSEILIMWTLHRKKYKHTHTHPTNKFQQNIAAAAVKDANKRYNDRIKWTFHSSGLTLRGSKTFFRWFSWLVSILCTSYGVNIVQRIRETSLTLSACARKSLLLHWIIESTTENPEFCFTILFPLWFQFIPNK